MEVMVVAFVAASGGVGWRPWRGVQFKVAEVGRRLAAGRGQELIKIRQHWLAAGSETRGRGLLNADSQSCPQKIATQTGWRSPHHEIHELKSVCATCPPSYQIPPRLWCRWASPVGLGRFDQAIFTVSSPIESIWRRRWPGRCRDLSRARGGLDQRICAGPAHPNVGGYRALLPAGDAERKCYWCLHKPARAAK